MTVFPKRSFCIFVCLVSFMAPGALSAQEAPVEASAAAPTPTANQDAPEGWAILERALDALAESDEKTARSALEELAAQYPEHPASRLSADALATLQARALQKPKASHHIGRNGEEETNAARAELVAFQTVHGIALGAEFCSALECDDARLYTTMLAVGGGAGLGLSLLASDGGVTPGFATLINSGTLWGAFNGAMLSNALNSGDDIAAFMAPAQLAGIGVSALLWNQLSPTAGEVSVANSGGIWLGTLTALGQLAVNHDSNSDAIIWSILGMADLGIVGGALLSQYEPMTRGRALVIDTGGVLGGLVGMGTYVLINPEFNEPTGFALSTMAGIVAGLGTSAYLTRHWDAPDNGQISASWGIAPTEEGAVLSLSGQF